MNILHIDASARSEGSYSRALSAHFVATLCGAVQAVTIDRLDLAADPPRSFGALEAAAVAIPAAQHSPEMRAAIADSDRLAARVLAADALVIGTPIYNFGMPSTLKAFFDHISRNGLTFIADETGMRGLLSAKRAALLIAAGGAYGHGEMFYGLDCLTPHAKAIFGFMGLSAVSVVHASPLMFAGPDSAGLAFARAQTEAENLALAWAQRN